MEKIKNVPQVLGNVGRSALRFLRRSGSAVFEGAITTAAVGVVVAQEANAGLKYANELVDTKTREAQDYAREKAAEIGHKTMDKAEELGGKLGTKLENTTATSSKLREMFTKHTVVGSSQCVKRPRTVVWSPR